MKGLFLRVFWADPDARIASDIKMRRALYQRFGKYDLGKQNPEPRPLMGSDMLACGYLSSQILGCQVDFAPDDSPEVHCANLDDEAAFALEFPDFDKNPVWKGIQHQLDYLQNRFGHVESYINFSGVQNLALDLRGTDLFLNYYDEDSPAAHLLEVSYLTTRELCHRLSAYASCLSAGVSNIVESVLPDVVLHSNCSVEMISEETYTEWLLPFERMFADEFPVYGIHHCGQSMEHVIHGYTKVPNLCFVEVGAFSDLAAIVVALNPKVLVNARYSPVRLATVSDSELRQELADTVRILPGRRLSISCVGVDSSVPDERVRQFCAYCKELLPDS